MQPKSYAADIVICSPNRKKSVPNNFVVFTLFKKQVSHARHFSKQYLYFPHIVMIYFRYVLDTFKPYVRDITEIYQRYIPLSYQRTLRLWSHLPSIFGTISAVTCHQGRAQRGQRSHRRQLGTDGRHVSEQSCHGGGISQWLRCEGRSHECCCRALCRVHLSVCHRLYWGPCFCWQCLLRWPHLFSWHHFCQMWVMWRQSGSASPPSGATSADQCCHLLPRRSSHWPAQPPEATWSHWTSY